MKKLIICLLSTCFSINFAVAAPVQKLAVALDWELNPNHAPLIIAQQQGFFKAQNLEVEFISPTTATDSTKLVANGKADIGITYEPDLLAQIDQGLPLIRIGTLIDKPLNSVVALKSSGIKTLADLKGKRIATSTGKLEEVILKLMLAKEGLTDKDVKLVNTRTDMSKQLVSRQVDVTTGMMRNQEVSQLEANGHKPVVFFPEEHGVPNYSELVFVVNTANTKDKRVPRFLNAVKQAVAYLDAHPQETWKQFAKEYPKLNTALNRQTWFNTMPYFSEDPAGFNRKEWEKFARFMHQNQMIKKLQPVSSYAIVLSRN